MCDGRRGAAVRGPDRPRGNGSVDVPSGRTSFGLRTRYGRMRSSKDACSGTRGWVPMRGAGCALESRRLGFWSGSNGPCAVRCGYGTSRNIEFQDVLNTSEKMISTMRFYTGWFRTGMVYILTRSTKPRFKIWGLISYRYGLFLTWTAPKVKMNHTTDFKSNGF